MCAIYGFLNYKNIIGKKYLGKLLRELAVAAECRGTDATGVAYVHNGTIRIHKDAKPAHKMKFCIPDGTTAVIGHNRMTTQGSEKINCNNHPFLGFTNSGQFALAHNGVLYNDEELRLTKHLPDTEIETDSYIAVQLLEHYGNVDFNSLAEMAETVDGSFAFSVLDCHNKLWLVKGSNPICLVHFPALGVYAYSSTKLIMLDALAASGMDEFAHDFITLEDGDIVSIDSHGNVAFGKFEMPKPMAFNNFYGSYPKSWYGYGYGYGYDDDEQDDYGYGNYDYTNQDIAYLYDLAHYYNVTEGEIDTLLAEGFTVDEIEEILFYGDYDEMELSHNEEVG